MRYVFKFEYICFAIYSGVFSFSNWRFNRITDLIKFLLIALFKKQAASQTVTNGEGTTGALQTLRPAETIIQGFLNCAWWLLEHDESHYEVTFPITDVCRKLETEQMSNSYV